jgi:hypothetical protein
MGKGSKRVQFSWFSLPLPCLSCLLQKLLLKQVERHKLMNAEIFAFVEKGNFKIDNYVMK